MRKRFPALRVNLIDADLRGTPQPWAHDLHAQILFDQGRIQASAFRDLEPDGVLDLGMLASHQLHDLSGANLSGARLDGAILRGTTLRGASLEAAVLVDADLSGADLRDASLRSAFLNGANLAGTGLAGADVTDAELSRTLLADVDLSKVKGLDEVRHFGPSEISMSTLIASSFETEPAFLRKAGVSRGLIEDLMRGKRFAGSYETCFLSYSSKDAEFAAQLYSSLTGAGVRVFWDHFDLFRGKSSKPRSRKRSASTGVCSSCCQSTAWRVNGSCARSSWPGCAAANRCCRCASARSRTSSDGPRRTRACRTWQASSRFRTSPTGATRSATSTG
jgi:hypothetical protein